MRTRSKRNKILTVLGARPQFVKAAMVSHSLKASSEMEEIIVHTGQHFDKNMSAVFFKELNIPSPQYHLDINDMSHADMTAHMLIALEKIMLQEKPDMVLVYGDTNSTLAGALTASKLMIPIAHVEAGLRSYNKTMPEEINRILVDHVSSIHLCPTNRSIKNLEKENIAANAYHVGDVMYDAVKHFRDKLNTENVLNNYGLTSEGYIFLTLHRAANVDGRLLKDILYYVRNYAKQAGLKVFFPIHPRTRKKMDSKVYNEIVGDNIVISEPLGYLETQSAIMNAKYVFTDSGGLQKEAYFHRISCVTLRDETEWVETIEGGWNRLWKTPDYNVPRCEINEYGDGNAAFQIVNKIKDYLN